MIALVHRGALTGGSALASRGIWRGLDARIHLLVPPHTDPAPARLRVPLATFTAPAHAPTGVLRHRGVQRYPDAGSLLWRSSTVNSIAICARTNPAEQVIAAIDSALFLRVLRPADLQSVFEVLPQRPTADSGADRSLSGRHPHRRVARHRDRQRGVARQ